MTAVPRRPHRHEAVAREFFPAWRLRLDPMLRCAAVNPLFRDWHHKQRSKPLAIGTIAFVVLVLIGAIAFENAIGLLSIIFGLSLWALIWVYSPIDELGGSLARIDPHYDAWQAGMTGRQIAEFYVLKQARERILRAFLVNTFYATLIVGVVWHLPPIIPHPLMPVVATAAFAAVLVWAGFVYCSTPCVIGSLLDQHRKLQPELSLNFYQFARRFVIMSAVGLIVVCVIVSLPLALRWAGGVSNSVPWQALLLTSLVGAVMACPFVLPRLWRRYWLRQTRAFCRARHELDEHFQKLAATFVESRKSRPHYLSVRGS